jgi:hypothetical protein
VAPDHSQSAPGPARTGADRAGYTRVEVQKRASFFRDNGPARADGLVPFFFRSGNIFFWLDPIEIAVSSDYPVGSCPYRVTWQHELSHAHAYAEIFHSFRDVLVKRLNRIELPTESSPQWVDPAVITVVGAQLERPVVDAVKQLNREMLDAMKADRAAKDSPSSYAAVYRQCSPAEWAGGPPARP